MRRASSIEVKFSNGSTHPLENTRPRCNSVYLTQERWEHIIDPLNHPEMQDFEEELKETVQIGTRKQDSLNPQKYRYSKEFDNLPANNTHIVAIVLFRLYESGVGEIESNNFIVTAYQKEIG